jgi:hypothetical protein
MTAQPIEHDEQERLRAELEADLAAEGISPMTSDRLAAPWGDAPWESEAELDALLADVYAARRRD